MTLNEAQDNFRANPCVYTAKDYLDTLREYKADEMIGDATYKQGIGELKAWGHKELGQ